METLDRYCIYQIGFFLDVVDILRLEQCCKKIWKYFNYDRPHSNHRGTISNYRSNTYFWMPKAIQLGIIRKRSMIINAKIRCVAWARMAKITLKMDVKQRGTDPQNEYKKIDDMSEIAAIERALETKRAYRTYREYEKDVAKSLRATFEGDAYLMPGNWRPTLPSIFDPRLGANDEFRSLAKARFKHMDTNREMLDEDYEDVIYKAYYKKIDYNLARAKKDARAGYIYEDYKKEMSKKLWTNSAELIHLADIDLEKYQRTHIRHQQVIQVDDEGYYIG